MPELPEVETVVRDLRPYLTGACITSMRASAKPLRKPWKPAWNRQVRQHRISSIRRRGKWIVIDLDNAGRLVIHLGMTGQLTVVARGHPHEAHTHLVFDLDDGSRQLRFRDIRRFGSATWFADEAALECFFQASGLGPEPFTLEPAYWRQQLQCTNRCLKAVLLDQQVAAGVGNIYADEALFEARLHPARLASELSAAEAGRLRKAIAVVLTRAIERRGSSIRNYVGGSGLKGEYQNEFRAYGRTGQPCTRCGTPIVRVRLAGRSTHYCPRCQRERMKDEG